MARAEKRIGVIDAETDPFLYGRDPKPFAWGYFDGETYVDFWAANCTEQLIDYLRGEDNLILYAHNGGKFDFFYLLPWIDPDVMMINGRIAKCTLFDGRIELRDSYLILPLPLAQHDKDEINYAKFEADVRENHKPEIRRYLQKDCRSLWDWVLNFRTQFGGGLTLAGTAFKQLKKTDYKMEATTAHFDDQFRPFYQGGRVQCFEVGAFKEPLQYFDINSAYPRAMLEKHWCGSSFRETMKIPDNQDNGSFYVRLDAVSVGCLPYKENGKTFYPTDNVVRTYHASGWEVLCGLKTDTLKIKKIHRVYLPTFKQDFKAYVDKFFKMKNDAEIAGDKTLRQFAKLMLNSCYGKFGQDGRDFEKFLLCEFGEVPSLYKDKRGEFQRWQLFSEVEGNFSLFVRPDPVDRFYNVATAASVTGFVRAYWWEAACKSEGVIYGDTDSMLCRQFGGVVGAEIGEWKLEANITEAYIAQRKMYALLTDTGEHKVASKGVRLIYDQIKEGVLTGKNIDFTRDAPAFSLKFGARYTKREVDFKNLAKNACNNPQDHYTRKAVKKHNQSITHSLREILCNP